MPIIKCKMCGGDLRIEEGSTVCECEYCGTRQTVPSADNEKKLTLFNRAGRLLRACEFDKAAGVFETIVADFPQEAEAYWGLVLCKYGIEYVDDPATGKKIPTCHRSSFENVLKDANFEQACENTDAVARRVYRDEARAIEELRKGIIEVSGKEEPYDVFISYKETDEHGERTPDSELAQQIYRELTREGYRVFFSRISLESHLGAEYEPYIFAALNSAKVMIVVGTDYENFDAVWVKNEWSRYLKLIAAGQKKTLIPVFRDMDAYDMPEEFSKLTALDMGRIAAMEDLVHGVEKLVGRKKAETAPAPAQQPVYVSGGPNVAAMIERGHQALEDGEWQKADEFFDQALNIDAKCAEAFLGKFLAQEQAVSLDAALDNRLAECDRKAVIEEKSLDADTEIGDKLAEKYVIPGYLERSAIESRLKYDLSFPSTAASREAMQRGVLERLNADKLLSRAKRYATGGTAAQIASSVQRFVDQLAVRAKKAREEEAEHRRDKEADYAAFLAYAEEQIEALHARRAENRDRDYQEACRLRQEAGTIPEYEQAIKKLTSTGLVNYKDSARLDAECRAAIDEINEKTRRRKEAEAKAAAEKAERERAEREKAEAARKKKNRTTGIVLGIVAVALVALIYIFTNVIIPSNKYAHALELVNTGNYEEAIAEFSSLDDYKDSKEKLIEAQTLQEETIKDGNYQTALSLLDQKEYERAAEILKALGDFKDSKAQYANAVYGINNGAYQKAQGFLSSGEYDKAIAAFEALGNFENSETEVKKAQYSKAEWLQKQGRLYEAAITFYKASGYNDAKLRSLTIWNSIVQDTTLSAGCFHTVAIKNDGSVIATAYKGDSTQDSGQCDVSGWTEIKSVATGNFHTVGLREDGTVVAVGNNSKGQCNVSSWKDIVMIDAAELCTVGLKADGTVVIVGYHIGKIDAEKWTDLIAVSVGSGYIAGIKEDGSACYVGYYDTRWINGNDVIAVSVGSSPIFLYADGTVGWTGDKTSGDSASSEASRWKDIIAISADGHYVGLRSDGTVVVAHSYNNTHGQDDVSLWKNIVEVSAGKYHTVGLRSDGTVVSTAITYDNGGLDHGQCDVSGWRNIRIPN